MGGINITFLWHLRIKVQKAKELGATKTILVSKILRRNYLNIKLLISWHLLNLPKDNQLSDLMSIVKERCSLSQEGKADKTQSYLESILANIGPSAKATKKPQA